MKNPKIEIGSVFGKLSISDAAKASGLMSRTLWGRISKLGRDSKDLFKPLDSIKN